MSKGLGLRGREALFNSNLTIHEKQENDTYKEVSLAFLTPCSFQPRKHFDEENLKELASSIQEKGIVQPLVVRKTGENSYEIVAGERRFRAAKLLNLEKVPVIIREYTDAETMTIALVENLQRENLNPIEEAEAFQYLKETYNFSQEELAKNLGKSRPSIANALRLLNLPEEVRSLLLEGALSSAHGRTLLALENNVLLSELTDRIQQYKLSVRDTENLVAYANAYQRLPELTATPAAETNISPVENEATSQVEEQVKVAPAPASKRRSLGKSEFFSSLQKQLRKEVHRGTTISGTLENGKIVLPFAGKEEFEILLKLLAFGGIDDVLEQMPEKSIENLNELALATTNEVALETTNEVTSEAVIEDDVKEVFESYDAIEEANPTPNEPIEIVEITFDDDEPSEEDDDALFEDFLRESKAEESDDEPEEENLSELHTEIIDNIKGDVQNELSSEVDLVGFPFDEESEAEVAESIIPNSLDEVDSSFKDITEVFEASEVNFENIADFGFEAEVDLGKEIEKIEE